MTKDNVELLQPLEAPAFDQALVGKRVEVRAACRHAWLVLPYARVLTTGAAV